MLFSREDKDNLKKERWTRLSFRSAPCRLILFFATVKRSAQIRLGTGTWFEATAFIFKHGLWTYYLYPVILSVLLFIWGMGYFEALTLCVCDFASDYLGLESDPDSRFMVLLGWLVSLSIHIIMLWTFFSINYFFMKYAVLILLSPVLARLSARTEELLTGVRNPFVFSRYMKDMGRGIFFSVRNMIVESLLLVLFFFLNFIPGAGIFISMIGMALVSWYFFGFSMMDYFNERKKRSVSESVAFARSHRWLCISNGCFAGVLFYIPWFGPVFAPVTGVVAATLAAHKLK